LTVRVRLRLKTRKGKEELTVALVNSVFESDRLIGFVITFR